MKESKKEVTPSGKEDTTRKFKFLMQSTKDDLE
jgi:hypothetical protein